MVSHTQPRHPQEDEPQLLPHDESSQPRHPQKDEPQLLPHGELYNSLAILSYFLMVSHTQPRHPQEDEPQLFSHGESYSASTSSGG